MGQVCVSHLENTIRGAITFHIRQNRRGKRNITKVIDDVVRSRLSRVKATTPPSTPPPPAMPFALAVRACQSLDVFICQEQQPKLSASSWAQLESSNSARLIDVCDN